MRHLTATTPARLQRPTIRPGDPPAPGHRWAYAYHLSRLVAARGMSWADLSRASGINQPAISSIMHGHTPREQTVDRLLAGLKASRADLMSILGDRGAA